MNLDKSIIDEIVMISKKYENIEKVVVFGSRARGDNETKSDIDLAVYATNNIAEFIEEIEMRTSTLLEFDFSDMNRTFDPLFVDQVEKDGVVIYEKH